MRIQHNIAAMNSYRNFSANSSSLNKNLEKLSTGYKINRAGDDAAGLAISEKMRAQITGLEGATKNAKDGISLIQTAEGALTEVHSMLNRMTTLAEQSANGTYDNELDRNQLQKEVQALKDEIDRIADSTNFNGLKLLDGSLAESSSIDNSATQLMTIKGTKADGSGNNTSATVSTSFADAKGVTYSSADISSSVSATNQEAFEFKFTDANNNSHTLTLSTKQVAAANGGIDDVSGLVAALNGTAGEQLTVTATGDEDPNKVLNTFRDTFTVGKTSDGKGLTFQVKNDAYGARLDSVKMGSGTTIDAALATNALTMTEAKGKAEGMVVTLGGDAVAGERVQIGSKVYEFVANSTDTASTAGATAVHIGTGKKDATNNLLAALKDDGYSVELEDADGTAGQIRFTDLSQISEGQGGGSVTVNSDYIAVRDQEATNQTTTLKVGGTGAAATETGTISISYVDAEGKNQSKEITYTGTGAAATDATAIMNKLKDDSDLNGLFEFEIKAGSTDTVKITSRSTDNTMNQIGTITLSAKTTASGAASTSLDASQTQIAAGLNDGKAIELRNADGQTRNIAAGDTVTINGKTYEFAAHSGATVGEGNARVLMGSNGRESLKNLSDALTKDGFKNSYDAASGKVVLADRDNIPEKNSGGLSLQIGDTADSYNKLTVSVTDMHSEAIGIGDVDISTQDGAAAALDKIKSAINNVSDVRGSLGALQNRLDHTINNLGVMRENIQNAESSIRDTDVAEEMMEYTKNSILNQSAQAMLAQANQLPQGVLQLLG